VGELIFRLDDILPGDLVIRCVSYLIKANLPLSIQNFKTAHFQKNSDIRNIRPISLP
jgi:hypothetical protein